MSHNYPSTGYVTLNFVRICLNKFYEPTKSIKNPAFENFKLFSENQPRNKIGLNYNKQMKLYETDGAVRNLLFVSESNARVVKTKQRGSVTLK